MLESLRQALEIARRHGESRSAARIADMTRKERAEMAAEELAENDRLLSEKHRRDPRFIRLQLQQAEERARIEAATLHTPPEKPKNPHVTVREANEWVSANVDQRDFLQRVLEFGQELLLSVDASMQPVSYYMHSGIVDTECMMEASSSEWDDRESLAEVQDGIMRRTESFMTELVTDDYSWINQSEGWKYLDYELTGLTGMTNPDFLFERGRDIAFWMDVKEGTVE